MQIIYHPRFTEVYAADPAAARGRLDAAIDTVSGVYPVLEPSPAADSDILLVHSEEHLQRIRGKDRVYDLALLAGGGAVKAAETACSGKPGFGLIIDIDLHFGDGTNGFYRHDPDITYHHLESKVLC